MPLPWLAMVLISFAMQVIGYVITPKPKGPKPEAVKQAENPTASADRPIPKLWGSARISETNVLGFWDKSTRPYQVKV